jgi:hypothetical protein
MFLLNQMIAGTLMAAWKEKRILQAGIHPVRQARAGGWSWSCVREKHCCLAGGWRLELELCEKKIL